MIASAPVHSAIYTGLVRHRRYSPRPHAFRLPLFMVYLDLAELPGALEGGRMVSARKRALARFRREDYLGPSDLSLDQAVRTRVRETLGFTPAGPIRLLTHLRIFGYIFNPVSFYYCFDGEGERVDAIVAEITNTPWKERHAYVLDARAQAATGSKRFAFDKAFHVSPFMPMDLGYDWRFGEPGRKLGIFMRLTRGSETVFDATLAMERRPLTRREMRRVLCRYPFMTMRVIAKIHWEALKLWMKRVPVHPHPRTRAKPTLSGSGSSGAES